MEFTLKVFKREVQMKSGVNRNRIVDKLNMKHSAESNKPVLQSLVRDFQRVMDQSSSSSLQYPTRDREGNSPKNMHQKNQSSSSFSSLNDYSTSNQGN